MLKRHRKYETNYARQILKHLLKRHRIRNFFTSRFSKTRILIWSLLFKICWALWPEISKVPYAAAEYILDGQFLCYCQILRIRDKYTTYKTQYQSWYRDGRYLYFFLKILMNPYRVGLMRGNLALKGSASTNTRLSVKHIHNSQAVRYTLRRVKWYF